MHPPPSPHHPFFLFNGEVVGTREGVLSLPSSITVRRVVNHVTSLKGFGARGALGLARAEIFRADGRGRARLVYWRADRWRWCLRHLLSRLSCTQATQAIAGADDFRFPHAPGKKEIRSLM